jgi:hypothetical protein
VKQCTVIPRHCHRHTSATAVAATSLLKLVSLVIVSLAPVVRAADPKQELNDDILQLICEVAVWLLTWTNR